MLYVTLHWCSWIKPHLYGYQNFPLRCGLILSVACIWIMRSRICNTCISVWSRSLLLSLAKLHLPPEISSKLQPSSYTSYTGSLLTSNSILVSWFPQCASSSEKTHFWMDNQHLVRFTSTKEVSLCLLTPRPFQEWESSLKTYKCVVFWSTKWFEQGVPGPAV